MLKVLGGAFLVLAAAWGLTLSLSNRSGPQDRFLWEEAQEAQRLTIGDTTLTKAGDGWTVEKPFKARADKARIEDLLGKVSKATLSDSVSSDPERHEYFMVTPSSGIRFQGFLGGETPALDIFVGKSGSDYDSLLVRRPSEPDVLEARGLSRFDFEQGASRWTDRTLAKLDSASIRAIEIRGSTESVKLSRSDRGWRLEGGVVLSTSAVSRHVDPILSKLSVLEADEVLPPAKASSAALKRLRSPELRITVRYTDGGAKGTEKTLALAAASKDADSRCAVRKQGDELVYMLASWQLDSFRRKAADFR
jgi:hypothetical protein